MRIANLVTFIIVMIGVVNWGLVGIFNWNFVSAIFGAGVNIWSSIVYIAVLLSGIWLILSAIYDNGQIRLK